MIKAHRLFLISLILISVLLITTIALISITDLAFADPDPEPPTTYNITWLDEDDSILRVDHVNEGEMPSYGEAPTKAATAEYIYTFSGWTPNLVPAEEDTSYKATYLSHEIFTISIYDEDLEGTPTCVNGSDIDKIFTILEDNKSDYFYSYYKDDLTPLDENEYVSGDVSIIRKALYKVTIRNYVDSLYQGSKFAYYEKGQTIDITAIYGDNPKYNIAYNEYDLGSSQRYDEVTNPKEYVLNDFPYINNGEIAFDMLCSKIPVLIRNDQNSITTTVYYLHTYDPLFSDPIKTGYTFKGWTYEGVQIKSDTPVMTKQEHTLVASFEANQYQVNFHYPDGQTVVSKVYFDSKIPVPKEPTKVGYTFNAWQYNNIDMDLNEIYKKTYSIDAYPRFTANTYKASITLGGYELNSIDVKYDQENVEFGAAGEDLPDSEYFYLFGLYYEEGGEKIKACGPNFIIDKWTFAKDMSFELSAIIAYENYSEDFTLDNCYIDTFGVKATIDDNEYKEKDEYKAIGNHTIKFIDSENNVVFTHEFVITEDFGFDSGDVLTSPIYLKDIDAQVYVDNELIEDLSTFRIDKSGVHSITVLGANGYSSSYAITYENKNLERGWWILGISGAMLIGIIVLAIFGRRKVVMYFGKH